MNELESAKPEKTGTWLYGGRVPCEVRVVRHHTLYGSGDYEDAPEVAEDRSVECFYVLFHTPAGEPEWVGGGAALSLNEAMALAQKKLGHTLVWL
jgi:hypothetical protein